MSENTRIARVVQLFYARLLIYTPRQTVAILVLPRFEVHRLRQLTAKQTELNLFPSGKHSNNESTNTRLVIWGSIIKCVKKSCSVRTVSTKRTAHGYSSLRKTYRAPRGPRLTSFGMQSFRCIQLVNISAIKRQNTWKTITQVFVIHPVSRNSICSRRVYTSLSDKGVTIQRINQRKVPSRWFDSLIQLQTSFPVDDTPNISFALNPLEVFRQCRWVDGDTRFLIDLPSHLRFSCRESYYIRGSRLSGKHNSTVARLYF